MAFFSAERRKYLRHPIHVPVLVEIPSPNGRLENVSESIDLSKGGISFLWELEIKEGTIVEVTLPVKEKLFRMKAEVRYSKPDPKNGRFRTGICFSNPEDAFKAKLAEEAIEIIEYRKKRSEEIGRRLTEEEAAQEWIKQYAQFFPKLSP